MSILFEILCLSIFTVTVIPKNQIADAITTPKMNNSASLNDRVLRKALNIKAPSIIACGFPQTTKNAVKIDLDRLNVSPVEPILT